MSTIEVKKITKKFGDFTAVRDADLKVSAGEVVCLLGPSGCGKTTTLRMIAGLGKASRGRLLISGRTILGPSADVGVVFQNATLLPWLTLRENVRLPLRVGNTVRAPGSRPNFPLADERAWF